MASLSDLGDPSPKTYIVLGCHRSGTSFLTKALLDAGVKMGGQPIHYENGRFVSLNKDIIQGAGGTWRQPPEEDALLESGRGKEAEIVALLRSSKSDFWGWKDPRQALTVRSYLPHLEDDVYLIAIFRKPDRVKASLRRLGQTSIGDQLARTYARRILAAIAEFMGL